MLKCTIKGGLAMIIVKYFEQHFCKVNIMHKNISGKILQTTDITKDNIIVVDKFRKIT